MANKKTVSLTAEQYAEIIRTMREGGAGFRPNDRIAAALMLEANLGLRISDILALRLQDIVRDGNRYRLDITEIKTGKPRYFTVPVEIYSYLQDYCMDHQIRRDEVIFDMTERAIQKYLVKVTDYLGIDGIGTHSFRKFFATQIYVNNNYNIVLVQQLLQHSSPAITQRYIGISTKDVEDALSKHLNLCL